MLRHIMNGSGWDIHLRTGARTSTGQVRENNEDSLHLWEAASFVLAVVADGMGGAAAGEEASRIAVEAVEDGLIALEPDSTTLRTLSEEHIAQKLREAIRRGNLNIVRRAAVDPEMRGMGTTVTLAFVRDMHAIVAHVGDSRAYLVDSGTRDITQITDDHSLVEALVAAGHLTHEQAQEHPLRNVLYRALGQNEDVDVDIYEAHLRVGDRLVLCSDGLTRHVKPFEIAEAVLTERDPERASQKLIDLANERGGEDNVSVIVIAVEGTLPEHLKAKIETLSLDPDDTIDLRVRPMVTEATDRAVPSDSDTIINRLTDTPTIPFDTAPRRECAGEGRDSRVPEQ
jgi:protein phosphatase